MAKQGPCTEERNTLVLSKCSELEVTPCADTQTQVFYFFSVSSKAYIRMPAVREFIKLSQCGGINVPR